MTTQPPLSVSVDPERWLEDHGDCLFHFAVFRVRNEDVAEDLVQETLLAALKAQERYQGRANERSWLVGILKNKIMDHFRKMGRETPFTDMPFLDDELSEKFQDDYWIHELGPKEWTDTSGERLDRAEFWAVLRSCLSKLPRRVADVFLLREMDGQSTDAICRGLNITPSNLWVMLHRARMALRECLELNWFGDARKTG